jgi:hypothetical protein
MSNDHIYVVIVPHADQAAQSLTTARAAVGTRALRRESASEREHTGKTASTRRHTGKTASTRAHTGNPTATRGAAAKPAPRHPASASPASRRLGGGYVSGTDHNLRTWSVVVGDDKYNVTDSGSACGYRIECEGNTVWTGIIGRSGQYDTHTTTLATGKLDRVLRLVYVGDQRHARAQDSQRTPAAPKSTTSPEEPKSTRWTKDEASPSSRNSAPPSSATRSTEPKKSASPRTHAAPPHAAKPEAKRPAKATTRSSHRTHASPSGAKAPEKSKAKRQAKPKAASVQTQAGPLAQRAPVSQPSAKPPSRRAALHVDDKAILHSIKENLHKGDPATAESHFKAMKRLWLGGGREATVAWMAKHEFSNVVDAFDDWMEKNVEAARAMLHKAPHGAPKHEQVA